MCNRKITKYIDYILHNKIEKEQYELITKIFSIKNIELFPNKSRVIADEIKKILCSLPDDKVSAFIDFSMFSTKTANHRDVIEIWNRSKTINEFYTILKNRPHFISLQEIDKLKGYFETINDLKGSKNHLKIISGIMNIAEANKKRESRSILNMHSLSLLKANIELLQQNHTSWGEQPIYSYM